MNDKDYEKIAKENLLRESSEVSGVAVKGYDFNSGVDYAGIVESFASSGAQASEFSKAVGIVNDMIRNDAFIFLGYTSNMISSGNREIIRWLSEHKKVNVLVTTAGGIEEDIIKCLGDFYIGDTKDNRDVSVPSKTEDNPILEGFRASGTELRKNGINRIGNIFVSNNRYIEFEEFVQPILEELYLEQRKTGKATRASDIIYRMGEKINDKESVYYWAWKNGIQVYCPALLDGALGDNIYFFKFKHSDFVLDISEDIVEFNNTTIGIEKSGVIVLGAGVVKHSILNANMLRNGADYAVYINTAVEYDASDSGALPEEAVSWGKILPDAKSVKVFGDATILFPLLVAESFAKKN
ncbi:deoxyhypusine synthase [Candidatus Pacearchaeota archaeon CG10_big_fil_rev_8_21_14_0_10_34_76]|nr:MAG: deoxyhypusine synthase [Candidatus Pacearchaeota archaeon CG10_big_fil_rev_8_21_14_0_10_34_76]